MSLLPQPLAPKFIIRILVGVIIMLTFLAGYFHSALEIERQKNEQLQSSSVGKL